MNDLPGVTTKTNITRRNGRHVHQWQKTERKLGAGVTLLLHVCPVKSCQAVQAYDLRVNNK